MHRHFCKTVFVKQCWREVWQRRISAWTGVSMVRARMARFFSRAPVSCCFSDTTPAVEYNATPASVTSHRRGDPAAGAGG
ncbi:hypothetical protein C3387_05955 [Leclercia sp. LSNIH6]|nr:hypothetical protein C3370_10505 [Leclercia sp. LSNIH7]POU79036.1 hypothetical protein C3387_05955 [Leclercia sp. LSNIH6]POW54007.1 hypothetical protein C3406_01815 [Leclercia sp. LSNIH8]